MSSDKSSKKPNAKNNIKNKTNVKKQKGGNGSKSLKRRGAIKRKVPKDDLEKEMAEIISPHELLKLQLKYQLDELTKQINKLEILYKLISGPPKEPPPLPPKLGKKILGKWVEKMETIKEKDEINGGGWGKKK